jgi:hypothetical protein
MASGFELPAARVVAGQSIHLSFLLLFSNHDSFFFSRMIGGFSGFVCRAIDRQLLARAMMDTHSHHTLSPTLFSDAAERLFLHDIIRDSGRFVRGFRKRFFQGGGY